MSNYNNLKTTIDASIKQNSNQEITGSVLNSVLNQMVTILGTGYQFAGVAVLDTDPGTPDAKVFYIANGKGKYEKFGGLEVTEDEVVVLCYDITWHKVATGIASQAKLFELEGKTNTIGGNEVIFEFGTSQGTKSSSFIGNNGDTVKVVNLCSELIAIKFFNGSAQVGTTAYLASNDSANYTLAGDIDSVSILDGIGGNVSVGIDGEVPILSQNLDELNKDFHSFVGGRAILSFTSSTTKTATIKAPLGAIINVNNQSQTSINIRFYKDGVKIGSTAFLASKDNANYTLVGDIDSVAIGDATNGDVFITYSSEYTELEDKVEKMSNELKASNEKYLAFHGNKVVVPFTTSATKTNSFPVPANGKVRVTNNTTTYIAIKFFNGSTQVDSTKYLETMDIGEYVMPSEIDSITLMQGVNGDVIVEYIAELQDIIDNLSHKWKGKKWACVGDSLTALNIGTTKHYYNYVADSTGIEPYIMGVGGSGYKRTEENNTAFYQRVENIPTDVDVITIFGSGNDIGLTQGNITDTTTDTICGCINQTLDRIYTRFMGVSKIPIIGIVSPTPWVGNMPFDDGSMKPYVEALKQICNNRSIPYLDLYYCSLLNPDDATFRSLAYSKDNGGGVHPDENGHKIIAPRFKAFLETLLM